MRKTRLVLTCRVIYMFCFKPFSFAKDESNKKYMATLLIPKEDAKAIEDINKAIENAVEIGCKEKWNGVRPNFLTCPLKDGDEKETEKEIFANNYYIVARSKNAPEVVDQQLNPIYDPKEIYSGCYCNVSVTFTPYLAGPNKGITAVLGNIQLIKQGPMVGKRCRAVDEFSVIDTSEEQEAVNTEG